MSIRNDSYDSYESFPAKDESFSTYDALLFYYDSFPAKASVIFRKNMSHFPQKDSMTGGSVVERHLCECVCVRMCGRVCVLETHTGRQIHQRLWNGFD